MDMNIRNEIVNDFEEFYRQHPSISLVIFDSLTAQKIYQRDVIPTLNRKLKYMRVPFPSPAHARLSYTEKLALWLSALKSKG